LGFLKRSLAREKLKEAKVTTENNDFAYGWARPLSFLDNAAMLACISMR
jgi:hypothetical protein